MTFFKGLFKGIGIGLAVAVGLFAAAFVVEFLNCLVCWTGLCGEFCGDSCYTARPGWQGREGVIMFDAWCVYDRIPSVFPIWTFSRFINTLLFTGIAGTIVGAIYGVTKQSQESSESARRRAAEAEAERKRREEAARKQATAERQKNANDFKHTYKMVTGQCELNKGNGERVRLSPSFEVATNQEKIWISLNEISIPLQELEDSVAEMLSMKGDV